MTVKGFIMEDEQGREFVLVCEPPLGLLGRTFSLRGWQRRRLIPLQYTEQELRKIVAGVLVTLNDLFQSLPRLLEHVHGVSSDDAGFATSLTRETPILNEVARLNDDTTKNKWPS